MKYKLANEYFACRQRGFFKNSTVNLLPTLRFLGELYNFCNHVFFNVSHKEI